MKDAEFQAVLPYSWFRCQLHEAVATDGWILWVTSEVVPDHPAGEKEINPETVKQEGFRCNIM